MRNSATILLLKSVLSGQFQLFNTIDRSIEMLKSSQISKIYLLTRPEQRAALRKLFSLPSTYPSPDKILLRLWNKNSRGNIQKYTDICFQSTSRMRFQGIKKSFCANVISDTKQKHVFWNICKARKSFSCVAGAYCSQCQVS